MKQKNTKFFAALLLCTTTFSAHAQNWSINGNAGTSASANFIGTTDTKPLIFRTNNKERMRILPGGKIGIGTTIPDARFNVAVGGGVTLTTTDSFLLGSISGSNLAFDNNEIQARYNGSGNTLYLNYWGGGVWLGNHSGTTSPGMYINTNGTVGIGSSSTNAAYALSVNPSYAGNGLLFNDPVDGLMAFGAKSGSGIGMLIENTSAANTSPAMYGFNSGPGYGVYGYTAGGGGTTDPFGVSGVYGYNSSYGYGTAGYCNNGSGLYGYSANYVGVWGATGNSSSYAGYFQGNVYSTGTFTSSDQKLKQNIEDVNSAMDIINQLHPKKYDFRQDGNYKLMNMPQGKHYGLIAQEVEKILPNIVKDTKFDTRNAIAPGKVGTDGKTEGTPAKSETIEFKAVNYTELIPIMIKGMQELQNKVTELENTIAALKSGNSAVSAANASEAKIANNNAYLKQNAPNPFMQNTTIQYSLPASAKQAQLVIYGMDGRQVKAYTLTNGANQLTINAGSLSAGQYMYSLVVDGAKIDTKSMMLTK